MKKTLLLTGAVALLAAPLIAQDRKDHEGHDVQGKMMPRAPMTRAEVEARVKTHFAEMDANKDGAVTQAEVDAARAAHKSKMQDEMFAKIDTDKDGSISRAEFDAHHQHMMSGHMPPPPAAPGAPDAPPMAGHGDMKMMQMGHGKGRMGGMGAMGGMDARMFSMADANKDGKVTEAEATAAALSRFDAADTNKDGTISDAERQAAREKMRAAWKAKKPN